MSVGGPVNTVPTNGWMPVNGWTEFLYSVTLPFVDAAEFPSTFGRLREAEYTDGILMCATGRSRVMYVSPCGEEANVVRDTTCPEACDP